MSTTNTKILAFKVGVNFLLDLSVLSYVAFFQRLVFVLVDINVSKIIARTSLKYQHHTTQFNLNPCLNIHQQRLQHRNAINIILILC